MQIKDIESYLSENFPAGSDAPHDYARKHLRRFADTLSLLPFAQPGQTLLDVGVYPGHMAVLAKARGYTVSGITNAESPDAFQALATRLDMDIRRADIEREQFPFENDTFDAVLFCEVLEHLYRNPFHALSEIFRVLKPGGILILTTPNLAGAEKMISLFRGHSPGKPLSGPLSASFPSLISHTHFREYTWREIIYLLQEQTKQVFWLSPEKLHFSKCWQPTIAETVKDFRQPLRFLLSLTISLISSCIPRFRSCIMVRARKPSSSTWVPPEAWKDVQGFYDTEHDRTSDPSRLPVPSPFRWTTQRAGLSLANPWPGTPSMLTFRYGLLCPALPAPLAVKFHINDILVHTEQAAASTELTTISLPVSAGMKNTELLRISISTDTWKPAEFGFTDDRNLGIMIAWEPVLFTHRHVPGFRRGGQTT